MAFGLFKKNTYADQIYFNGVIHTQDPDFPMAEAVACKDGIIQAVGENGYMEEFKGPDTEEIDLEGKHLYPGFINTKLPLVYNAFKDLCLCVDPDDDLEYVYEQIQDYYDENPDLDTYFVFGFNADIFEGIDNELVKERLDAISIEVPLLLLDHLCVKVKMNSIATQILEETADEECVEIITLPYIINLFLPFDYEESQMVAKEVMGQAADMGFTSVLALGTPSFMDETFLNALLQINTEEDLKQRYFFSLLQNFTIGNGSVGYRLVNRKTSCLELGDLVSYNCLNVRMDIGLEFEPASLAEMVIDAAERGFNVHIDCPNQEAAKIAYQALDTARSKGYTKPEFVIGLDDSIEADWENEFIHFETIQRTGFFNLDNDIFVKAYSTQEALDQLTTTAAELIGMADMLGSIEPNKYADFTAFDEDILEFSLEKFTRPHCSMTVVGGEVAYDAQVEADNEMFDMISLQQF